MCGGFSIYQFDHTARASADLRVSSTINRPARHGADAGQSTFKYQECVNLTDIAIKTDFSKIVLRHFSNPVVV